MLLVFLHSVGNAQTPDYSVALFASFDLARTPRVYVPWDFERIALRKSEIKEDIGRIDSSMMLSPSPEVREVWTYFMEHASFYVVSYDPDATLYGIIGPLASTQTEPIIHTTFYYGDDSLPTYLGIVDGNSVVGVYGYTLYPDSSKQHGIECDFSNFDDPVGFFWKENTVPHEAYHAYVALHEIHFSNDPYENRLIEEGHAYAFGLRHAFHASSPDVSEAFTLVCEKVCQGFSSDFEEKYYQFMSSDVALCQKAMGTDPSWVLFAAKVCMLDEMGSEATVADYKAAFASIGVSFTLPAEEKTTGK